MHKDKKIYFIVTIFLFMLFMTCCHRYECCNIAKGPQIEFPVAPKEKSLLLSEQPKVKIPEPVIPEKTKEIEQQKTQVIEENLSDRKSVV